jgi:hypothetical protein
MIAFYLLVKSDFPKECGKEVARIMYVTGLFACFCVINFYRIDWALFMETKRFLDFQSSNNLSTFLMLAMPFPLLYGSRRYIDIISAFIMYICIIFTGSRGGLFMGSLELMIILLGFAIYDNSRIFNHIFYGAIVLAIGYAVLKYIPDFFEFYRINIEVNPEDANIWDYVVALKDYFLREATDIDIGETRVKLFERMFADFKTNPIFGTGIGYTGNADIYDPQKGAMNWYHMWFAQVVGGLGIVGILAYGYQLIARIKIFLKNTSLLNFTLMLSYLGLFLMSQVNPGEFCPMPYAALAVTYFIIMEKDEDDMSFKSWWNKIKAKFKKKTA